MLSPRIRPSEPLITVSPKEISSEGTEEHKTHFVRPEPRETPIIGCIAGIVVQFTGASYAIATKAMYSRHEDMHPMQMAAIRSVLSCLIIVVMLNKRIKYVMYDNVERHLVKSLCIKVAQNNIGVSSALIALKYLSLTTVSMVFNCTPFLVIVGAYLVLGESTRLTEFLATFIAVVGATLLIFGADSPEETENNQNVSLVMIYILIGLVLICKSAGTILMRILKKLDNMTVVSWQNFCLGILSIAWVYGEGGDFSILSTFNSTDYAWLALQGVSIVLT